MPNNHLTATKFSDLGLNLAIKSALEQKNFTFCTLIQQQALPYALAGKDVAGQAQTGTGKTLTFLLATFNRILSLPKDKIDNFAHNQPKALILAPTRELAIQIAKDGEFLAQHCQQKIVLAYGGDGYDKQLAAIADGVDILIGTTGRIIEYVKQNVIDISKLEVIVLDEADRMFDLGFIKDIRYIMRKAPKPSDRLSFLFSATLSFKVRELAFEDMNDPVYLATETQRMAYKIQEEIFYPSNEDKMQLLQTLIEEEWPDKCIIFANTKGQCERINAYLEADKHRVGLLTGDVAQNKRIRVLKGFASGDLDILVATDVAARGIHIDDVSHVFNYDLPDDYQDYVHRAGRTARAGKSGLVISFACETYAQNLTAIENYIGHSLPVSGYDSSALLTFPKPRFNRGSRNNRTGRNNKRGFSAKK